MISMELMKVVGNLKKFFNFRFYQRNFSRVYTIAEKNVKLQIRFKFNLIFAIVKPFLTIFLSLIILSKFFEVGTSFGRWDDANYFVFLFLAYNIELMRRIIEDFPGSFMNEKYWKTLPALMIAPFNKLHLLFGIILSHLFIIAIPFTAIFIITYIVYPISFFTIIAILFIFLLIDLIFSGIGLFLGVFAISREGAWRLLILGINIIFWFSCVTYPFEIFPEPIQRIIELNPLYYIFDILRITWLDDNILFTLSNNPFPFIVLLTTAIIVPLIAMYVFKLVYNKFGIVGY